MIFLFGQFLESAQSAVPKLREVITQERQAFRIQFVNAARALAAVAHQPRFLEHAEVLGDRGTGYRKPGGELVDSTGMRTEHFEDGQAGGIAKSGKAVLYVSAHLR